MYLWRVDRLVEDLRSDRLTEWEGVKYLITLGVVYTLFTDPFFVAGIDYSRLDALSTLIIAVATASGTYYCYTKNRAGDDRDFVRRLVCLTVPVGVRMLPVVIVVGAVFGMIFTEDWPGFDKLDEPLEPYRTKSTKTSEW